MWLNDEKKPWAISGSTFNTFPSFQTHGLKNIEREMFYLTTHSTHFIYGYMASDIWLRTILIVRKETRCRHIGYSYRLAARVLLYAPSHRQDNTYHGLCYTSRGALAGTRNSSQEYKPVPQCWGYLKKYTQVHFKSTGLWWVWCNKNSGMCYPV